MGLPAGDQTEAYPVRLAGRTIEVFVFRRALRLARVPHKEGVRKRHCTQQMCHRMLNRIPMGV